MSGFVFFDTETTGLDPAFDQIVHFAAIHTDHDLHELDRFELRSRLLPHVVPHPSALRANGIPIERLTDRNLPSHYEMVCEIRQRLIAWSPSIFTGFNSTRFDEEMLRHALFQCLHYAYLTSDPKSGRADVFGLVQAACAMSPGCLAVPRKPDGRPSFRLSDIAAANDIEHASAHDAMSDTFATVELCRHLKDRSPESWQRFVRFSNKAAVADFVENEDGFILTEFFGGVPYHRAVVCIDSNPNDRNARFCLDLSRDPAHWHGMSDDELHNEIARKGTPVRRVRTNRAPTLTAFHEASDDIAAGLDLVLADDRARKFKEDPDLCRRIVSRYTASWDDDVPPSPFIEKRLYSGGFPGRDDQELMIGFHDGSKEERAEMSNAFEDPRLRVFAGRLVYSEHRSVLNAAARLAADLELNSRLLDDNDGPLTLHQAYQETEKLIADDIGDLTGILAGYRGHLGARLERATEFRRRQTA